MTDTIDAVVLDWRPSAVETRRAIRAAIIRSQNLYGYVHITTVREVLLRSYIVPAQVGAVICREVRAGRLVPTGRYMANADVESRNRTKPAQVYTLVAEIPEESA